MPVFGTGRFVVAFEEAKDEEAGSDSRINFVFGFRKAIRPIPAGKANSISFAGSRWGGMEVRILVKVTRSPLFQETRGVSLLSKLEGSPRSLPRSDLCHFAPFSSVVSRPSFFVRLPTYLSPRVSPRESTKYWPS